MKPGTSTHYSATIYALCSTEDMRERYVGQTIASLPARLQNHFRHAYHPRTQHRHVSRWIRRVIEDGFDVDIIPLQFDAAWGEDEKWWIAQYRANGFRLTNATDGGDGALGVVWGNERRQQLSQIMKGKPKSAAHRAALSEARKGVPLAPGVAEKVSAALKGKVPKNLTALHQRQKGRPLSAERRAVISTALKGRRVTDVDILRANLRKAAAARGPNPPETRAKISAALKGKPSQMTADQRAAAGKRIQRALQDPAVRAKLSQSLTGKALSQETIAKRTATRRANGGFDTSEETRRKQSASAKIGWEKRRKGSDACGKVVTLKVTNVTK